ncbi:MULTISPECIES: DsbA family protein [unclassified Rhizobium]|jgi:putative protein-disulfide isomerase|uniref:DsbA family protein n=1 Tax=unclassified Rhizobium TaxID=2613769 RepID=UPI00068CD8C5|nr:MULTISPECIES: DsbA family protein [unclassified Rhizobium]OJY74062.1 MAG: hypothetical protein BGP09_27055 [Rhizobium sp. 60-20]RKD61517.1 putative protein-disulfide isomerase [Rhizobium sp. WW_1]
MTTPILHYIHDPLCGWCYAASPMVEAVANAGIPIALHGGGLMETPTRLAPDKRAYIRRSDAHIAELTGVTFGAAYLDGLLVDADSVFWSRPTIAAVLAAGTIERGAELRMLRAIQHAHYVEGRRVVDVAVLTAVAGTIGLAENAFSLALESVAVDEHIAAARRLMQRAGLRGFPGFLLERGADLIRVEHEPFYGRPAEFVRAIKALDWVST